MKSLVAQSEVGASRAFFCTHLGYRVIPAAADGFASLSREDVAAVSCCCLVATRFSRPGSVTGRPRV
ncbi:hypothetical protein [Streptomyces sp. NPDC086989]|uniref:hypothetical protein n=1 Tax=Streptomyces sp. NPDC086989 TaxID=3365764 RepID=UPI0037F263D8